LNLKYDEMHSNFACFGCNHNLRHYIKARNEDLTQDVAEMSKRLAMQLRRAEEAEAERDELRATAEKDSSSLQKKVEMSERAAEVGRRRSTPGFAQFAHLTPRLVSTLESKL